ncbi:MAG: glutathione S-transferase family protein [Myxococcota bacterium]
MSERADLLLYTASTMNGWKPLIFLEEVGTPYELIHVSFAKNEQKAPAYVALNPNGRIPTLVDRGREDFVVFESGAILWYLAERFDRFLPSDAKGRSQALQWLMFQMSGVGPMMGQAMYFQRIAAPKGHEDAFAIERYVKESRRLLEVLDGQLRGKAFVLGDAYSIADMALYPWVRSYPWAKVDVAGLDALRAWMDRLDARPAIQRAVAKPEPFPAFFGKGPEEDAEAFNASRF